MKVLFLLGKGRSGSTLLDNPLHAVPGVFSVGELWRWRRGRSVKLERCGCGVDIADCPVWGEILHIAFGRMPKQLGHPVDAEDVFRWEKRLWNVSCGLRLLQAAALGRSVSLDLRKLMEFMA